MDTPPAFHRLVGFAVAILVMGTFVTPSAQAADRKPPRIRSAVALDTDADDKINGFQLTYNEKIRHPSDADGTYPISIVGYQVTKIEAASGKTLVVRVSEQSSPDISASPIVIYKTGILAPVKDRAGNKAKAQNFSRVVPLDVDGDGDTAVGGDCAPADPQVGPSATDQPDLALMDPNCDGIDGDAASAVFVSTTGSDSDEGTAANPKLSIGAALATALAANPTKDVYVATGTYDVGTGLTLSSGAHIFGGYDSTDWSRSVGMGTAIEGAPVGIVAISADAIELQNLQVSASSAPGSDGVYAAFLRNSSAAFAGVTLEAAAGGSGIDGSSIGTPAASGGDGAPGGPGVEHSTGLFCDQRPLPAGGAGGTLNGVPSAAGGAGGIPGAGSATGEPGIAAAAGTAPGQGVPSDGNPSMPQYQGADGANGSDGSSGLTGASSLTSSGFVPGDGAPGGSGQPGAGGGGGGGGGGGTADCDSSGSSGGGGGAGAAGGAGGGGGSGGASSIALYLWSSSADVTASSALIAGDGGDGGDGGAGQPGGAGGASGPPGPYGGSSEQDDGTSGGHGGAGGAGGMGGPGAGGSGGSSICVWLGGTSVATLDPSTSLVIGTAGAGGGGPGTHGVPGVAAQTLSP